MILLLRSFSRSRFDFPIKHENKNTAKIIGFLFILRPTPSRLLSLICGPQLFPRPQGVGCAGVGRFAGSGRRANLFAYSLERAALSLSLVRYYYPIRRRAGRLRYAPFLPARFLALSVSWRGGDGSSIGMANA